MDASSSATKEAASMMLEKFKAEAEAKLGRALVTASEEAELRTKSFEELETTMKRAHHAATELPLQDAVRQAGDHLDAHTKQILQVRTMGLIQEHEGSEAQHHHRRGPSLGGGDNTTKAMRFLNNQYKEIQENMDVKLFECGMFKVREEGILDGIQNDISATAKECGRLDAEIMDHQKTIIEQTSIIQATMAELDSHNQECATELALLNGQLQVIVDDLNIIKLIQGVADKECAKKTMMLVDFCVHGCKGLDGKAEFSTDSPEIQTAIDSLKTDTAKEAARRMLWEAMDMTEEDDPSVKDLGALPLSLDAEVGEAGDDIGDEDDEDEGPVEAPDFLQFASDTSGETEYDKAEHDHIDGASEEDFKADQRDGDDRRNGDEMDNKARVGHHLKGVVVHQKKLPGGKQQLGAMSVKAEANSCQTPGKVASKPSRRKAQQMCPLGTKPRCPKLLDKLAQMEGELIKAKDAKEDEIAEVTKRCNEVRTEMEQKISDATEMLNSASSQMASAQASLSQLTLHGITLEGERHEVCEGMREKYGECYKEIKAFEEEICGVIKVRDATYKKLNPKILDPLFQDCEVGGYTPGECSKTCLGADGLLGKQPYFRQVVVMNNSLGAACPPLAMYKDCGEGQCPIDCVMDKWSGWSRCTKDCGGGTQRRIRKKLVEPDFGGTPCGAEQESQQCNTDSCDADCILDDWATWSPCSKSCRPYWWTAAGFHRRKAKVRVAVKGKGTCPSPWSRARYNVGRCNNFRCPRNMECIAPMDNILVMDGSGSLWYWSWNPARWPTNFERMKAMAVKMVEKSKTEGWDAVDQEDALPDKSGSKKPVHVRYGAILFASRVKEISALTGNKKNLVSKIKAMKWPMSGTYTHLALGRAMQLLKYSAQNRMKVITLITDGRPTDGRKTKRMARTVKKAGITLKIIPVGRGISRWQVCQMASRPCKDNVETARAWWQLKWQFNRFQAATCPMVRAAR